MAETLDAFCRDCHDILARDPGPSGREAVRRRTETLLQDEAFVDAELKPRAGQGTVTLYEDPDLGYVVLSHSYTKERYSPPHDHGSSWAVYAQVAEHSDMGIWERTDGGTGDGPAEVVERETMRLEPGEAALLDVGVIHTVDRPVGCHYLRVTGTDLEKLRRLRYDPEKKQAVAIESVTITP